MNKIHLIGNAHLDPVWLWQWYEGYAEYENDVYGYWHMIGSGER